MPYFRKKNIQESFVVGICGRSCSGKGALTEALASINREVLLLQADYYFHQNTTCTYKGYPCIEHTNCISFDRLIDNTRSLKERKDTVIHVETPWMRQVNIEISHEDMLTKKLIIVDGFLIFAVRELVDLLDFRIFVDISDYNLLRRRLIRDGFGTFNYICDVVIPVSKEYEQTQKDNADIIIDGNSSKDEVTENIYNNLLKNYRGNADFNMGLPPKKLPWEILSGDLLMDHEWHPIYFEDLKDWVKENKNRLDVGEELKGNTFRYRKNPHSGGYEVRLSTQYKPSICRYTREPT